MLSTTLSALNAKNLFTCVFVRTGKIQIRSRGENKQSGMGKENGQHSEEVRLCFFFFLM